MTETIRTSDTHPLAISEVRMPESHADMALAITFLPGKRETTPKGRWERDLETDLAVVRDWRPTDIVLVPSLDEQSTLAFPKDFPAALRAAKITANLHQCPVSDWPAPENDRRRDIDAIPVMMTMPGRRVLVIGRHGMERSAVISAEILMRDGVLRDLRGAIKAVQAARPDSLATQRQIDYLAHHWERRRLKGAVAGSASPVDDLKIRARRLRRMMQSDGIDISHSQALERVAHLDGFKDWNTMQAACGGRRQGETGGDGYQNIVTARASTLEVFQNLEAHEKALRARTDAIGPAEWCKQFDVYRLGPGVGFYHQRARDVSWGIIEGVRSFFGEDDPRFIDRLFDATRLGVGIPPHLVPKGGYETVGDIPDSVLEQIAVDPGFLELVVLHEAGYGTDFGRECLRRATIVLFGFDLKRAINGEDHIRSKGKEHFHGGSRSLYMMLWHIMPSRRVANNRFAE